MEQLSKVKSFGGFYSRYQHQSKITKTPMEFGIFLPSAAAGGPVPCLLWLSGLTCNDENFMTKAGAHRVAEQLGLAILCPDTSPRGAEVSGEDESYDLGTGAGFYLDATEAPWAEHYQMESYLLKELLPLCEKQFDLAEQWTISGHSMGGHGAITLGLRHRERFGVISAFSPICQPTAAPWGEKAFTAYLGSDQSKWLAHDSLHLIANHDPEQLPNILIDQGSADQFLDQQLGLDQLESLVAEKNLDKKIKINRRKGYDHSYFFVSSFIEPHLEFHKSFHDR